MAVSSSNLAVLLLLPGQAQIGERHRIEVIVGQGDKAKAEPPQSYDLVDHALKLPLPGLLPIRSPYAAKGTVLGAAANSLHGGPHVLLGIHQIPARGQKLLASNSSAFVDPLRLPRQAIDDDFAPGDVPVSLHHRMAFPTFQSLFGEERGVNAAIDYPRSAAARHLANLVAAQGIARMHADAHDVSRLNCIGDDLLQRFIHQNRIANRPRRGCRKHKQPSGRDDRGAK